MLTFLPKVIINISKKQCSYYANRVIPILCIRNFSNKSEGGRTFSLEEQDVILKMVNESTEHQLRKHGLSELLSKTLVSNRLQHGPFKTFEEFIHLEHPDMNDINEYCKSIIYQPELQEQSQTKQKSLRAENVLAVHIGINAVCWSLLNSQYQLLDWSYKSFLNVSPKNSIISLVELAHDICHKLPPADVYVLEPLPAFKVAAKKQIVYLEIAQRQQLHLSILTCLARSTPQDDEEALEFNHIFLLEGKKVSQFFGIKLGDEAVSSDHVVKSLMSKGFLKDSHHIHVFVNKEIREHYMSAGHQERIQMHHALLMSVLYKYSFESNKP